MAVRIVLILVALGLGSGGLAQGPAGGADEPKAELEALADSCAARKFETLVVVDGSGRGKRVKICGKEGQSDADWLVTLRSSIEQTSANGALSQPVKDQIIAALKAEIASLESAASAPRLVIPGGASEAPVAVTEFANKPVSMPEAQPRYSSVPPLPPLKQAASGSAAAAPVARPRLSIRCALPRERFSACSKLERETQLLIRADEDLAAGTSLRFVRGGDHRGELELSGLQKGQTTRESLPGRVCSGVMRGKVEVQVLSKNRVAETLGPYALYCGS